MNRRWPSAQSRIRALASRAVLPATIVCAVLAPLAVHWLSGRTVAWFDTQKLYAPQRWLVDEALRQLRLPLWNPFMGAGMPLFAEGIHGVLHPISVLTAWLATDRSADLLIGGYVACAGLGAGLLTRDLGGSRAAAAAAGFAYGMSGFVESMAGNLVFLAGAGSLPLCVLGLRRFALDRRPGTLLAGVGGAAVLALSGDYQALVVGGALALALSWEGGWRGGVHAVAAGCVGLLVAGIQIVATASYFPQTVRATEDWTRGPTVWAFEPWRLPELLLPGLLTSPDPYADPIFQALANASGRPAAQYPMPFAASVFVGLLPLALAAVGAAGSRRGRVLALCAAALLWLALGPSLGASALLGHVPIWGSFRYSEKLIGPLTLVLATLAGLGLDAVVEGRVDDRKLLAGAVLAGFAAFVLFRLEIPAGDGDLARRAAARALRGGGHALAAAAALGTWLLLRHRLGPALRAGSLAALVFLGMAAASPAALHPGDPASRLRAPGPRLEAEPPGPRIVTPYYHDLGAADSDDDVSDLAARQHAALGYPAQNVFSHLDSLNEYSAMTPLRLGVFGADRWSHLPLAPRRFGATHVILDPPMTLEERALLDRFTRGATPVGLADGRYAVWALPHRPWASFAPGVRVVADEEGALVATTGAIVDEDPTVLLEAFGAFSASPGRVLSVERGLESLRIEGETPAEGTLVVNDAWWPGWEASLDGVATPVFRADAFVRAVRWPAGRHILEMRYRPPELRTGLLVSALGVALLGAWFAALLRLGRTRRATEAAR